MTCRSGQKRFGTKQDFIPLFFLMHVQILWQGQKAVLTIVEFEFFDIFYSKFEVVSTFYICSKFCVENWLLCCDMICKWVTCRSGCKRFWKSALHMCIFAMQYITCLLINISVINYPSSLKIWRIVDNNTKNQQIMLNFLNVTKMLNTSLCDVAMISCYIVSPFVWPSFLYESFSLFIALFLSSVCLLLQVTAVLWLESNLARKIPIFCLPQPGKALSSKSYNFCNLLGVSHSNVSWVWIDLKMNCWNMTYNYGLILAYLLLRVNCDIITHARWNFDTSNAWTQRVRALDKHQNWSANALFRHNSRA